MSEPYDDFDRALLRAGKKASAPTSRMRARALGAAAAAGAATAVTTKAAAATKVGALAKAAKTVLAMKLTMVAAVTTASVGTAVYVVETRSANRDAVPMVVAAPVAAPAAPLARSTTPIASPPPAETVPETAVEPEPAAEEAAVAPKPIVVTKALPIASAKAVDPLREELALVEGARRALAAGDSPRALRHVDDHARRFPSGALAVERDVLRIDALVAAGRRDEATTRARDFLAQHPGSAQARRIAKMTETNP